MQRRTVCARKKQKGSWPALGCNFVFNGPYSEVEQAYGLGSTKPSPRGKTLGRHSKVFAPMFVTFKKCSSKCQNTTSISQKKKNKKTFHKSGNAGVKFRIVLKKDQVSIHTLHLCYSPVIWWYIRCDIPLWLHRIYQTCWMPPRFPLRIGYECFKKIPVWIICFVWDETLCFFAAPHSL